MAPLPVLGMLVLLVPLSKILAFQAGTTIQPAHLPCLCPLLALWFSWSGFFVNYYALGNLLFLYIYENNITSYQTGQGAKASIEHDKGSTHFETTLLTSMSTSSFSALVPPASRKRRSHRRRRHGRRRKPET